MRRINFLVFAVCWPVFVSAQSSTGQSLADPPTAANRDIIATRNILVLTHSGLEQPRFFVSMSWSNGNGSELPKWIGTVAGKPFSGRAAIWRWASVTKQVVAVLVMQEVEKGRVALDTPATRYLPKVALPGGDAVTVRRLLNHTSGLYDPNSGPAGPDGTPLAYLRSKTPAPTGLAPQCLKPSGRAPGEGFVYNNCDYIVLGVLLERVTGKPFATLVRERIAKPLGLKSLRVLKPGDRDDIVAVDEKGATDANVDPGRYGSAANLAGTSWDLMEFDRALIDGKLLGAAATAEMWKGDPKLGYAALGQWSYPVKLKGCTTAQHVVERRGAVGNVQVRNLIAPERGIAVVAFTASTVPDFGEPWQGKGLTYELLSAALCPAS